MITCRQTWGEDRVYFSDATGQLISLPSSWTSAGSEDPFVSVSAGRSLFRVEDLLELARLMEGWER